MTHVRQLVASASGRWERLLIRLGILATPEQDAAYSALDEWWDAIERRPASREEKP